MGEVMCRLMLLCYLESKAEWLGVKAPEPTRRGSTPSSVTHQLRDLGHITQTLFVLVFSFLKCGIIIMLTSWGCCID